jgi:hypothetical protein
MKIKHNQNSNHHHHHQQQQNQSFASPTTPIPLVINQTSFSLSNPNESLPQPQQSSQEVDGQMSPSNQMLTRNRAAQQRQQHSKNDTIHSSATSRRISHQHHQHQLGKIVKPIPVRPMSSSASCSSSSNSSSTHHHQHNHLTGLSLANTNSNSFSLIAKYFASFPATRLKSTNNTTEQQLNESLQSKTPFLPFKKYHLHHHHHHHHRHPNCHRHVNHPNTDHLCHTFKRMIKLNDHKEDNNELNASSNGISRAYLSSPHTATSNTPTGGLYDFANLNSDSQDSYYALNNNNNEPVASAAISNSNTTTNSPLNINSSHMTQLASNHTSLINGSSSHLNTSQTNSNIQNSLSSTSISSPSSMLLALNPSQTAVNNNIADEETTQKLFGHITMETRSTRKFLIKHHPYMQQLQQHRPSINLIKMKKLVCNSHHPLSTSHTSPFAKEPILHGTEVETNGSNQLVKFTDAVPHTCPKTSILTRKRHSTKTSNDLTSSFNSPSPSASVLSHKQKNSNSTKCNKQTRSKSICNSNAQTNIHSPLNTKQKQHQHQQSNECCCCNDADDSFFDLNNYVDDENEANEFEDEYELNGNLNLQNTHDHATIESNRNELGEDYSQCQNIDDSREEDSSGYYSSYHSVDLISTSGGSTGGDHHHHHGHSQSHNFHHPHHSLHHLNHHLNHFMLNRQSSECDNNTTSKSAENSAQNNETLSHSNQIQNSNISTDKQFVMPNHHYQTRYLSNLQQITHRTNTTSPQINTTHSNSQANNKPSKHTNQINIPTTRYQLRLAAAANKSQQLECDLDLDLIEND